LTLCAWGDEKHIAIELLLKNGANPNIPNINDEFRRSPLQLACRAGSTQTAVTLLQYGALTNVRDQNGNSVLHLAVLARNDKLVAVLLDKGLAVDAVDNLGRTPLHHACMDPRVPLSVVKYLVEADADLAMPDYERVTPWLHACVYNRPEIVHYLLSRPEIFAREQSVGFISSALAYAIVQDNADVVECLVGRRIYTPDSLESAFNYAEYRMAEKSQRALVMSCMTR
jgi:ankyrin repeat protein